MKRINDDKKKCVFGILVVIVVLFCNTFRIVDASTTVMSESNIIIDGYYDDWADKPYSWEYNWDNSSNCWIWGVYIDGVKYLTEYGTYDANVRHRMSLFCDGKYVYLYVKFSRDYTMRFNGEDYQFWFDNQVASFQVERVGGGVLTGEINHYSPGIYPVEVHHRDQSMSYEIVQGSSAYITVHPNQINNELELKIPLTEMKRQNPNISIDHVQTIEFFTPNLMYRRITMTGTSSGSVLGVMIAILSIGSFYYMKNRKSRSKE